MNEPEQHEDVLRDVLHQAGDHMNASPELAQRAERAARRRRTARRSTTGALALVAVGTTIGVLAADNTGLRSSTSPSYSASQLQLPACTTSMNAYPLHQVGGAAPGRTTPAGPVIPSNPVAAVLCRFEGAGVLAGSATVTDQAQLARLQTAVNAGQAYSGPMFCLASAGRNAVVVFVYPRGTANFTVSYVEACASLYTKNGSYLIRGDFVQLLTDWTGNWTVEASPSKG